MCCWIPFQGNIRPNSPRRFQERSRFSFLGSAHLALSVGAGSGRLSLLALPDSKHLIYIRRGRREAAFLIQEFARGGSLLALNLTWSGYFADQIAAAKANRYRRAGIERAMVGKNASSNDDCTGGASTRGRQPPLSNLSTRNDSSWIRAYCGLDGSLGIRAR